MNNERESAELEDASQAGVTEPSPGDTLREQREQRGLSLQQVADELHLTMHFIRALETDAYDKLPGDVFARGYLRAYANLLGLDSDKMMHAFNAHVRVKDAAQQSARSKRTAKRRKDKNLPWIVFSGVAFVVVAVILWYFNASAEPGSTVSGGVAASAAVAPTQARVPPTSPAGTVLSVAQEVMPTVVPPVPVAENNAEDAADIFLPATAVADADLPEDTAQSVEAAPTRPENSVVQTSISIDADSRLITVASTGNDLVRVEFSGDSWVEVDDSSEGQVFRDIRVAGDILEVRGTAPFSILLGDASAAEVYFNGNQVDIEPNIRVDNSARIRLDI